MERKDADAVIGGRQRWAIMRASAGETVRTNRYVRDRDDKIEENMGTCKHKPMPKMVFKKGKGLMSAAEMEQKDATNMLFHGVQDLVVASDEMHKDMEKWISRSTIVTTGRAPAMWEAFDGAVLDSKLYLFGGIGAPRHHSRHGGGGSDARLNTTFMLNLKSIKAGWQELSFARNIPSQRSGHTCTAVEKHMWVFGGEGEYVPKNKLGTRRTVFSDLYALDTENMQWRFVETSLSDGAFLPPSARRGHTATKLPPSVCGYEGHGILLFGGCGPDRMFAQDIFLNDIQLLDVKKAMWSDKTNAYTPFPNDGTCVPPPRTRHVAEMANDGCVYVHGGISYVITPSSDGPRSSMPQCLGSDEVYRLNTKTWQWTKPATSGEGPGPRYGHTFTQSTGRGNLLYLFGGRGEGRAPDARIFVFDARKLQWSTPKQRGVPPCPRYMHWAGCSGTGRLLVFGGSKFQGYCNADIYMLDLIQEEDAPPEEAPPTPPPPVFRRNASRSCNRSFSTKSQLRGATSPKKWGGRPGSPARRPRSPKRNRTPAEETKRPMTAMAQQAAASRGPLDLGSGARRASSRGRSSLGSSAHRMISDA